ncbi:cbb3-type cytochrome oxidase assembly protein CcoS [Teredinibacter franksiae]|uniref:cbb3-type cytochrome oxidase assembly protein CcoS n=1 Tax=Teredinibacter franksiae TaxID=2761453 RepID=UPI00162329A5|nr:cbb3-type cytochrome oxidase assembly protein CcoS [Teredinibacter franksiae]
MQSLLILIPIAIVFVIIAVAIFFWAVRSGQYEDLETEARRILFEDDSATNKKPADGSGKVPAERGNQKKLN